MLRLHFVGGNHAKVLLFHVMAELNWLKVPCGMYNTYMPEANPAVAFVFINYHNLRNEAISADTDPRVPVYFIRTGNDLNDAAVTGILDQWEIEYKTLPNARASVPYIVKKTCEYLKLSRKYPGLLT
jgi:hypothetical protein